MSVVRHNALLGELKVLIQQARTAAARNVNSIQVLANFEIGRRIVEEEQNGLDRADYGANLLQVLASELTQEFGLGFSKRNLNYMRKFYLVYRDRQSPIVQKPSAQFKASATQKLSGKVRPNTNCDRDDGTAFGLSWSHYVFLLGIKRQEERHFYEIEASKNGWSLPELRRQFDASLFERLALSCNPGEIHELARKGQILEKPRDILKDPYVLEFLGLEAQASYSESQLEAAIIDKIESFLLELGKGFLFEARQKRFTFEDEHFFVDLVFYNRLLHCYVLIDLKIGKLTHQNLGQMQMYVNYFDRYVKLDLENPTIGIILCRKKNDALVEITLPKDANIHASGYQLYLPSKEELQERLIQWLGETGA